MKRLISLSAFLLIVNLQLTSQPTISLYPAQKYSTPYPFQISGEREKWNTLSLRSIDAPFVLLGEQRSKYVFTDNEFNLLDNTTYNYVGENFNNRIPIGIINNGQMLFGFVSAAGQIVVSPIYYDVFPFFEGRAEVVRGGKVGLINEVGKAITPIKYTRISDFLNGVAIAEYRGKYLLINESGEELTTAVYDHIGKFENNLAPVKKINHWGFIDRLGLEVIPVEYEFVTSFEQNRAVVGKNLKFGLITNEGILLTKLEYDEIGDFLGNWAEAKKNGKKLFLSLDGKEYYENIKWMD